MTCTKPGCDRDAFRREMCGSHYYKHRRRGNDGFVSSQSAIEHCLKLRDLGWTWSQVEKVSGVSASAIWHLVNSKHRWVYRSTRDSILAVKLTPQGRMWVSSVGTRRRLLGLALMGWTQAEVARRANVEQHALMDHLANGRIRLDAADRIARVTRELAGRIGPSKHAMHRARSLRAVPLVAWDDIDDPNAQPVGVEVAA